MEEREEFMKIDYNKMITKQIAEHESGITVVSVCFLQIISVFMIIFPVFTNLYDDFLIKNYTVMSFMLNQPLVEFFVDCYDLITYFSIALAIWTLVNVIQMICLSIDELVW